jgi:hypothetical protein
MIGSFHELHDSVFNTRRYSTSVTDGTVRNSIDENSSYDDLLKVGIHFFCFLEYENILSGNNRIT